LTWARAGQSRQNLDHCVYRTRLENARQRFVVTRRDTLSEVAVLIVHRRSSFLAIGKALKKPRKM